jgi:peptidoglycan/xylan/chitin deacetylase (PgdA/CDA1 family)
LLTRGPAKCQRICLTFDDGPHPEHTARLLDTLKDQCVRASFFVIGELAEKYPELVRRMAAEGHTIGNHTYYHTYPGLTTPGQLVWGTRRTQGLLAELTGRPTALMRPPHGKLTFRKLCGLWRAGQCVVLWSRDPRDYARSSAEEVHAWFRENPLQGGDVVLFHDRLPYAAEVLPGLISTARQRGLEFTTIEEWVTS